MTRLQEAQEWDKNLLDEVGFFIFCPITQSSMYNQLNYWQMESNCPGWACSSLDIKRLALAFSATAPKEFR